jgi:hypothetical protein
VFVCPVDVSGSEPVPLSALTPSRSTVSNPPLRSAFTGRLSANVLVAFGVGWNTGDSPAKKQHENWLVSIVPSRRSLAIARTTVTCSGAGFGPDFTVTAVTRPVPGAAALAFGVGSAKRPR